MVNFKAVVLFFLVEYYREIYFSGHWRIRNPTSIRFTFRQNHSSRFIQRRLDYIIVSNSLQESIQKTHILPLFCGDHSPIFTKAVRLLIQGKLLEI